MWRVEGTRRVAKRLARFGLRIRERYEGLRSPRPLRRNPTSGRQNNKWCAQRESNPRTRLRRPVLFPLSYGRTT